MSQKSDSSNSSYVSLFVVLFILVQLVSCSELEGIRQELKRMLPVQVQQQSMEMTQE